MTSVKAHIYQLTSTSRHQTVCVCHRVISWNLQMTNDKCAGSHQLVDINQQTPNSLSSERCHQLKSATNISDIIWEVSTEICNQPLHWLQWHLCRFTSTSCVQRPFCRHQTVCHRVTSYNDFPHDSFFNHSSSFFSSNTSSPPTLVVFLCTFQKRERCWSSWWSPSFVSIVATWVWVDAAAAAPPQTFNSRWRRNSGVSCNASVGKLQINDNCPGNVYFQGRFNEILTISSAPAAIDGNYHFDSKLCR